MASRERPPSDIRRGLVASTWEGAFAQAFITWTSGVFLVEFARRLGADDVMLGWLAALPFLAQTVQIATAWVYERADHGRRDITAWTLLLSRLLWVVPAALALHWLPEGAGLGAYLGVVGVSAMLATAGAHGWQSWMADLVPPAVRGRYFGFRSGVAAGVAVAAGTIGGRALDALDAVRDGAGFAAIYLAAAVAGALAWFAMARQYHPRPAPRAADAGFAALWREVWSRPDARRIFAFFAAWNVGLGIAMPFWADYMKRELGMPAWQIGLQNTLGAVVGVFLARPWGRLVDRIGARTVLLLNAIAIAMIPFLWLAAGPGTLWPVWLDAFVVGVFWTGFNLTALNVPLSAAAGRGGALFLGIFGALTGLAMGAASITGGYLATAIGRGPHVVLGLTLSVHQVMFLISGGLRALAIPLAVRLPNARGQRLVFLFQVMGYAVRHRLNLGRQVLTAPWRRRDGE